MDKQQNELIKSYYRSRNQALDVEGEDWYFQSYEYTPIALEKGLIDKKTLDKLNLNHLSRLLVKNPTIADYVDYDKLIQISDTAIVDILYNQPSLIKHFKHTIKVMNPYSALKLVSRNPEYMEYANDKIFYGPMLTNLLTHQPQFYERFKHRIADMPTNEQFFTIIGKEQPELLKQMFKDNLLPPSSIHDALTRKWITAEDFTKEQLIDLSKKYNSGMSLFFLLKDHPELLKYHTDWYFDTLNERRKQELKARYDRLIELDHNYRYLQDIIDKHLLY